MISGDWQEWVGAFDTLLGGLFLQPEGYSGTLKAVICYVFPN